MNTSKKIALCILIFYGVGCTKYLDAVPDQGLTVPQTLADFRQMLENEKMFNNAPALGEFGTDDIALPDDILATRNVAFQNGYLYAKDIFAGLANQDWNNAYEKIYYANIVLAGVDKMEDKNVSATDINSLKGWALFCRANAFYDLQEIFGQPYRPSSAVSDLGIPLKLGTNLTQPVSRATVKDTYQRIITDLEEAALLLPAEVSKVNRSMPSKSAAYGLLSRVYLMIQDYAQSLRSANSSLELYNTLVDYNTISTTVRQPFNPLLDEIIYHSLQLAYLPISCPMDHTLYDSYDANDLRKTLYYTYTTNSVAFKGYYSGNSIAHNGLATDEIYLTQAECNARLGNSQKALDALNTLLVKRYKTSLYIPYTIFNTPDILKLVLTERRKECVFRNLRWSDLRRLNQDTRFAKTIFHTYKGVTYQLLPNDPKYAFPIPDEEVRLSGIQQNNR
jgi:hypothetical protein